MECWRGVFLFRGGPLRGGRLRRRGEGVDHSGREGGELGGRRVPPPCWREGRCHSGRSVVSPVGRVVLARGLLARQGRGPLAAHRGCWERGGV